MFFTLTEAFQGLFHVAQWVKEFSWKAGDTGDEGLIPESGRPLGGGHGSPVQYSCLENSMDRGAWRATVHGVAKSWTWLKHWSGWAHTQRLHTYPRLDFQRAFVYFPITMGFITWFKFLHLASTAKKKLLTESLGLKIPKILYIILAVIFVYSFWFSSRYINLLWGWNYTVHTIF